MLLFRMEISRYMADLTALFTAMEPELPEKKGKQNGKQHRDGRAPAFAQEDIGQRRVKSD